MLSPVANSSLFPNAAHQTRAVRGGVANFASLQHGKLTSDAIRSILRRRNNMQRANTFTVQACVLGKALKGNA